LDNFDFTPQIISPCVNAGSLDFGIIAGISLEADKVYVHPLAYAQRTIYGGVPDIGAYELTQLSFNNDVTSEDNQVKAYPNPFTTRILLKNIPKNAVTTLFNTVGQVIFSGQNLEQQDFSNLPLGVYYLSIEGYLNGISLVK
jgi:hypothetical protein